MPLGFVALGLFSLVAAGCSRESFAGVRYTVEITEVLVVSLSVVVRVIVKVAESSGKLMSAQIVSRFLVSGQIVNRSCCSLGKELLSGRR